MWSAQIRAGDVVAGPYAAASNAPIADRDISAVAARAMLTDELVGQRIPRTGPQALTNTELLEIVGSVLGRQLRYLEVPPEAVRERFIAIGFSAEFANAYILDRPAESFAQWVADHRASSPDRRVVAMQNAPGGGHIIPVIIDVTDATSPPRPTASVA